MGSICCKKDQTLDPAIQKKRTLGIQGYKGFKKLTDDIKNHYTFYKVLGKGSFGSVHLAENVNGSIECAVKTIEKKKLEGHQLLFDLMQNELQVLEKTTHPHIMRVFQLLEDQDNYYIISEILEGGELFDRIVKLKKFNESNAAFLVHQILLALNYMHSQNPKIVHRDLKPENILLESKDDNDLNIKITDFGFACFYNQKQQLNDVLGSPLYMAPEIIREQSYDEKVDIWSVGVITFILLSGRPPFSGKSKPEIFTSIKTKEVDFSNPIWNQISDEAQDFILLALQKDKTKRANAKQLLDHPWIHNNYHKPKLSQEEQVDLANNIREFKQVSDFAYAVLSCIVNLKATSEDLETLKNMFIELDTSKDGTLSPEEIKQGMDKLSKLTNTKLSKNEFKEILEDMDKDGNGVVDYQEFITAAIDKATVINKKNLQSVFQMIDRDHSGMLTIDELQVAFQTKGHERDDDFWQELMQEVDKNNDNQISFDEFTDAMTVLVKRRLSQKGK